MTAIIAALIPVFLLIATGVLCARYLVVEPAHWIAVERLVYFVLFPALLIQTLARADLSRVPVAGVGAALFGSVVAMCVVCFLLRGLLARRLAVDGPAFTSVFQGATRWSTFVALAVAGNLYGELGVALASVGMVAMIPALNVINVWVLAAYASPEAASRGRIARALIANPFIWACAVGITLNVTRVPIPPPLIIFAAALGNASLALGVMMVGVGLEPRRFLHPDRTTLIATALKLVLMPTMAITLGRAVSLDPVSLAVVACCAAVPAAPNAYLLARQMGGDAELMAQILTLQTLMAAITMPIAMSVAVG